MRLKSYTTFLKRSNSSQINKHIQKNLAQRQCEAKFFSSWRNETCGTELQIDGSNTGLSYRSEVLSTVYRTNVARDGTSCMR